MELNIRVAGEAGQGVQTTGDLLVNAFAADGLHVFSTQSYMSRIRGGLNWYDVRVSDTELWGAREKCDVLVALSKEALETLSETLAPGGVALFDGTASDGGFGIEFTKTARELTGSSLMANTIAAGAVYEVLGYRLDALTAYLGVVFKRKGPEVIEKNVKCALRGADLAREKRVPRLGAPKPAGAPHAAYSGADAIGLGAATSGVKFVAAYPMTPSTGIFTFLAGKGSKYGIVVEQAEDEIAAVNMVCGATYAGVPAMTTTAGGGFALMVEGLSLAGMLELPIFIAIGQRPAPATGLPTRTAQEDLKFALFAGHGEFARAVYAPGTLREAYALTRRALEAAHKFQTPTILLTDQFLNDLRKNIPDLEESLRPIDRCIVESPAEAYERYAITESGVSPRALPGSGAFVSVDSDEHWTDGHITEYLPMRVAMVDKRLRKAAGLASEALGPSWYGPIDAAHVLICWGSTYGPCREGVDILDSSGSAYAMMHFSQVWPVNVAAAQTMLRRAPRESLTSVEGNATGQFAAVLRQAGLSGDLALMTKYDGMPFTGEEIARRAGK